MVRVFNRFKSGISVVLVSFLISCVPQPQQEKTRQSGYPISGVLFNKVHLSDNFWLPKIKINREATIPASFKKCEEMGRLDNFRIAGGKMKGPVKGEMPFDDTDVYKTIEGAAYSMAVLPDPKLD
ncbi:MAG TPA: glycoside hydrolase family 127 protein, partial [Prolixibacteraceae bacterium]|nr:glycoside hydrolase family 127 protein [Prolixibacteraceae bacterium]